MITEQKYDGTVPLPGEFRLPAMTADQQIRAKALEHTVRLAVIDGSMRGPGEIREMCDIFECYIREGK